MTISVALCTYNGAQYLLNQLTSIEAQTRRPDEVVICDDSSCDGTVELIRSWADAAPFPVRVHVNPRNVGAIKNFERAVSLSCGDLIALADQDDLWYPNKLGVLEQQLGDNPAAGLAFRSEERR